MEQDQRQSALNNFSGTSMAGSSEIFSWERTMAWSEQIFSGTRNVYYTLHVIWSKINF
jgi:hypothetical protein